MMSKNSVFFMAISLLMTSACSPGGPQTEGSEQVASKGPDESSSATTSTAPSTATGVATSLVGNAAAGKSAFGQCRSCHVTDSGVNKIGPSLYGIVGRKAGSVPNYSYSAANAGANIIWTKEELNQFIENPQKTMPGTKMIFAGIRDAQKRADIIAYLENPA